MTDKSITWKKLSELPEQARFKLRHTKVTGRIVSHGMGSTLVSFDWTEALGKIMPISKFRTRLHIAPSTVVREIN